MAVSPVIANCVQVRLLWALVGNGTVNVLNASAPPGVVVNQTLANTVGLAIKNAFTANLGAKLSTSSALVRVGLRDMRVAAAPEFLDAGAAVFGTGAGDSLPVQTAQVVTLRTAKAGKSFRGRVYLSGFLEADSGASGVAVGSLPVACVAFINAVNTALTSSGMKLAVASRPAERTTIVRTIFHNDGTTTVKTLSDVKAKPGGVEDVTIVQSRSDAFETQRRHNNGRGAVPSIFNADREVILTP